MTVYAAKKKKPSGWKAPAVVRRAVERGVTFLDRKYGERWIDRIDLETFDIMDGNQCVLGQVVPKGFYCTTGYERATSSWGSFLNGFVQDMAFEDGWELEALDTLPPDRVPTAALGFNDGTQPGDVHAWICFQDLQREWVRVIKRLRRERGPAPVSA
jgi:hypothetical protein